MNTLTSSADAFSLRKRNIEKLVETKKENAKKGGWKKGEDLEFYNLREIEQ